MGQPSVWQSASGATASMVVTFDELSQPNLWNDEDRNPRETQPAASYSPETNDGSATLWKRYVDDWLVWVEECRSASTRISYGPRVRRVLERIGKADLRDVGFLDVQGCLAALGAEGVIRKPSTRNGYVAALRSYWRYLVDKLDLDELGVRDIGRKLDTLSHERVNREKKQYEVLSRDEFRRILEHAEGHGESDWALAARYKWTGLCRIQDVASLTWRQLDLGPTPKARYQKPSKHGSDLVRLLDGGLAKRLRALRVLREPEPDEPVFAKPGEPWRNYRDRFARHLKDNAARARIAKYVHPHLVRASARTHAVSAGAPEHFLDRQGGWSVRSAADAYSREDPETWREWVSKLALD